MDTRARAHVTREPAKESGRGARRRSRRRTLRTFSSQTYSFRRPFHSLRIPLAVSHPQPQLLLISWVTLHSRWASLLGGTTVDVFRDWGSGGVGVWGAGVGGWWWMSRNSQHICAPLPPPPSIPIMRSRPVLRHLPQRPALLGCLGSSAPPPLFLSFLFSFLF